MPWTPPTDRATFYTPTAADWNIIEDNLSFLYGDAAWTNVAAFTNSWAAGGPAPAYILIGRVVYLRGVMTAGTANTVAFTLPAGYRPSAAHNQLVTNGTGTANLLTIGTTGTVTPLNSAIVWLSNVSFPVV